MNQDQRVCKICMQLHSRLRVGKWKKDVIYRDERGLLWNGRTCGLCHREMSRQGMLRFRKADGE